MIKKMFKFNRYSEDDSQPVIARNAVTRQSKLKKWIATLPLVARNDNHGVFSKKFAFTLAEVLITLTIIGIIAALTIPNLMQSYKKHQVEVGVKEAYSILSNALTMAKAEHGSWDELIQNSSSNSYFVENYIKPYLKIQKSASYGGCNFLPYENCRIKLLDGTTENTGFGNPGGADKLLLDNGMYVIIFSSYGRYWFTVDINGAKKPNRAGYDIFYFSLLPSGYYTYYKEEFRAGFTYDGARQSDNNRECSTKGAECAYFIQKNGWKIPDNYPVKKW